MITEKDNELGPNDPKLSDCAGWRSAGRWICVGVLACAVTAAAVRCSALLGELSCGPAEIIQNVDEFLPGHSVVGLYAPQDRRGRPGVRLGEKVRGAVTIALAKANEFSAAKRGDVWLISDAGGADRGDAVRVGIESARLALDPLAVNGNDRQEIAAGSQVGLNSPAGDRIENAGSDASEDTLHGTAVEKGQAEISNIRKRHWSVFVAAAALLTAGLVLLVAVLLIGVRVLIWAVDWIDNRVFQMTVSKSPNDPKLSDCEAGQDACMAGLRGAGSMTSVAVRCSAWLGDWLDWLGGVSNRILFGFIWVAASPWNLNIRLLKLESGEEIIQCQRRFAAE